MKLCATIIEDRPIKGLGSIIMQHLLKLPIDTDLIVWCGDENRKPLIDMYSHSEVFPLMEKMTIQKYNELLTTPEFWDFYSEYDRVLVFQSDSMLLRKGIEEFYEWDYVGSPWSFQQFGANGGISLRNPKVMKQICEQYKYGVELGNEDIYFSNIMHDKNIGRLAPRDVCSKFGVEAVFAMNTLGYHAIDKWLTPEQCKQIREQYL